MRTILLIAALATFGATAVTAPPVLADPPPWAGVWRHDKKRHHRDDDVRVVYVERHAHLRPRRGPPVAQGLPYGFSRGTCDRTLVIAQFSGGMLVGNVVGGSMGRADRSCMLGALDHLPDRRAIAWQGDDGRDFRVEPVRSWAGDGGRYCREYQATALIAGKIQQTYGTACRQPDGQWQIID